MTVGPLEGITGALGDELNLLGGYRSTRVRTATVPPSVAVTGFANASAPAPVGAPPASQTITVPSTPELTTLVSPGMIFQVLDAYLTKQAGTSSTRDVVDNQLVELGASTRFLKPLSGFGVSLTVTGPPAVEIKVARFVFTSEVVGQFINLWKLDNAANLGTFEITDFIDEFTVEVDIAGVPVTEISAFAWSIEGVVAGDRFEAAAVPALETIGFISDQIGADRLEARLTDEQIPFSEEPWEALASVREAVIISTTATTIVLGGHGLREAIAPALVLDGVTDNITAPVGGNQTLTLALGSFNGSLVGKTIVISGAGSGLNDGAFKVIAVLGPTQTVYANAAGVVESPSSATITLPSVSWQIIDPGDTDIEVESTLDWQAAPGFAAVERVQYRYASIEADKLKGVEWDDGVRWIAGVKQQHLPVLNEAVELNRNFSGIDQTRQQVLVDHATGSFLSVIGQSVSVPRPSPLQDDDIYRAIIKAIAYCPRGTVQCIEALLDVVLGAENWQLFEDLTIGSINHTCTVFLRRQDLSPESLVGKAFVQGPAKVSAPDATSVSVGASPVTERVAGVYLAPEPCPNVPLTGFDTHDGSRLVNFGSAALSLGGISIGGPPNALLITLDAPGAVNAHPSDIFQLLSGPLAGTRGTIIDASAPTSIKVAPIKSASGVVGLRGAPIHEWPENVIEFQGPSAVTPTPTTVFLKAGTFGPEVLPGQLFRLFQPNGDLQAEATIISIDTDKRLSLDAAIIGTSDDDPLAWEIVSAPDLTRADFKAAKWKIYRDVTNARHYVPDDEVYIETAAVPAWLNIGTGGVLVPGEYTEITQDPVFARKGVDHILRVTETGTVSFEIVMGIPAADLLAGATDGLQLGFVVEDTEKIFHVGAILELAEAVGVPGTFLTPEVELGFLDETTGSFWHLASTGDYTAIAAAGIADGESFSIRDVRGKRRIYEFNKTGGTIPTVAGAVILPILPGDTDILVANRIRAVMRGDLINGTLEVYVDSDGLALIEMRQRWPGIPGTTTDDLGGTVGVATVWSGGSGSLSDRVRLATSPQFGTLVLVKPPKDDRSEVELFFDGKLVDSRLYNDFNDDARGVGARAPRIRVGSFVIDPSGPSMRIKQMDWKSSDPTDAWNRRVENVLSQTTAPNLIKGTAGDFVPGDLGRTIRIKRLPPGSPALNAQGGSAIGEWEIAVLNVPLARATVVGRTQERGSFTARDRSWFVVKGDYFPFVHPDIKGHSIEVLGSGPNQGVYPILDILDPETLESLDTNTNVDPSVPIATVAQRPVYIIAATAPYADADSNEVYPAQRTNVLVLDTSVNPSLPGLGFDINTGEVQWRIVPTFPTSATGLEFFIVDVGAEAGGALTYSRGGFKSDVVFPAVVMVTRSTAPSAYLLSGGTQQNTNAFPPDPDFYPFYINDDWGWLRRFLPALTAAGVIPDFDRLFSDGNPISPNDLHILDRLNPP